MSSTIAVPQRVLQDKVPGARLEAVSLPETPIKLWLLNADYPQHLLSQETVEALMDDPPYWAFCWASGWALARWIGAHSDAFKDRDIVDFGCGSGVAGIAAFMAGARSVIFCDSDEDALQSVRDNVLLNQLDSTALSFCADYDALQTDHDAICLVSDVFYDAQNLPLLEAMKRDFEWVVVADSRLRGRSLPGLAHWETVPSTTLPDLNEDDHFNRVEIHLNRPLSTG